MGIKTFLVKPTNRAAVSLRRYTGTSSCPLVPGEYSYHNASNRIEDREVEIDANGYWSVPPRGVPHEDPRWPTHCACGYAFVEKDAWQEFADRLYTDGAQFWPHRGIPAGAMYFEDWMPENMYWDNHSSPHLHVVTPGGTWDIDSRASNCTMPDDRLHRCWVRHGDAPNITVDKNGFTCAAGAGSIMCGSYHGFLRNGELT